MKVPSDLNVKAPRRGLLRDCGTLNKGSFEALLSEPRCWRRARWPRVRVVGVGDHGGGGGLLVHVGLDLLVHVGLGRDVVGLHRLLVHVGLGGDLLVCVRLCCDVLMHVGQSLVILGDSITHSHCSDASSVQF